MDAPRSGDWARGHEVLQLACERRPDRPALVVRGGRRGRPPDALAARGHAALSLSPRGRAAVLGCRLRRRRTTWRLRRLAGRRRVAEAAHRREAARAWRRPRAQGVTDLLIRGGMVIDGTGAPAVRADVSITAGRITDVGDIAGRRATRMIDARDRVGAPGFIDVR